MGKLAWHRATAQTLHKAASLPQSAKACLQSLQQLSKQNHASKQPVCKVYYASKQPVCKVTDIPFLLKQEPWLYNKI